MTTQIATRGAIPGDFMDWVLRYKPDLVRGWPLVLKLATCQAVVALQNHLKIFSVD